MSAANRLAALFDLGHEQVSEIEAISREIHKHRDLGIEWRPWWPSVGEVWKYKDQPPESMMADQRSFHLAAWAYLKEIWLDYQASTNVCCVHYHEVSLAQNAVLTDST